MRICLCFLGLQRTFDQTAEKILAAILDSSHVYFPIYVTWESEPVDVISRVLPTTKIVRIPDVKQDGPEFSAWKQNLQMHISWRRTYEPEVALFRYFQQIYLWNQAALYLSPFAKSFDLMVRLRTDVVYSHPLFPFYERALQDQQPSVWFSENPRQSIGNEGECCPDQIFFAKPNEFLHTLSILRHAHQYTVNYLETNRKWFPIDTWERNILQAESTLFYYVKGSGFQVHFLPISIEIIR